MKASHGLQCVRKPFGDTAVQDEHKDLGLRLLLCLDTLLALPVDAPAWPALLWPPGNIQCGLRVCRFHAIRFVSLGTWSISATLTVSFLAGCSKRKGHVFINFIKERLPAGSPGRVGWAQDTPAGRTSVREWPGHLLHRLGPETPLGSWELCPSLLTPHLFFLLHRDGLCSCRIRACPQVEMKACLRRARWWAPFPQGGH